MATDENTGCVLDGCESITDAGVSYTPCVEFVWECVVFPVGGEARCVSPFFRCTVLFNLSACVIEE